MNTHASATLPKSAVTATTQTPDPAPENLHIEPARSNHVNTASQVAVQNAASHVRDMLAPQDLAPQDGTPASPAKQASSSAVADASINTGKRSPLPVIKVLDAVNIPLPFVADGRLTFTEHDANTGNARTLVDIALPIVPPKLDIGRIGFLPGLEPRHTFEKVLTMNKEQRPPVTEYLSEQYIQAHRQKFASGKGYCIMSTDASIERVQANGRLGRSSGNFVLPEEDFKILLAKIETEKQSRHGDPQKMIEAELGFWPGSLSGKELVSYEIKLKPEEVRIPDGRGEGSNELWRPGGLLPTGYTEAVIHPAKLHEASKSVLVNGKTSSFATRTRMDVVIKAPGNWTLYAGKEKDIDVSSSSQEPVRVLKVVIGSVCKTAIFLRLANEDFERYSVDTDALKAFVSKVQDDPGPFIAESVSVLASVMKEDQLGKRSKELHLRTDGLRGRLSAAPKIIPDEPGFQAYAVAMPIPEAEIGGIDDDPLSNA